MNLFEARKSGKRYKRNHSSREWMSKDVQDFRGTIGASDLDADDYILEPDHEPVKKRVTVYRPIKKRVAGFGEQYYKFPDVWKEKKESFHCTDAAWKIVGWEKKQIEVTE